MVSKLAAICPLDGRYQRRTDDLAKILEREHLSSIDQEDLAITGELSSIFSEHALIRNRVHFEVDYFLALADEGLLDLSDEERKKIADLNEVTVEDAQRIKDIEVKGVPGINNGEKTDHDVKAVEYFMRDKLASQGVPLEKLAMIHFGLTSEDIDNMAYNKMLDNAVKGVLHPAIKRLIAEAREVVRHLCWTKPKSEKRGDLTQNFPHTSSCSFDFLPNLYQIACGTGKIHLTLD